MARTASDNAQFVAADTTLSQGKIAGVLDNLLNPLSSYGNYGRGLYGQGLYGGLMSNTVIVKR